MNFIKIYRQTKGLLLTIMIIGLATPACAEILFEGYSRILLDGTPVGYTVQRYEHDTKKKEFVAISYLWTNDQGGNITESLKARSTASLKPLNYQYTGLRGGKATTIDASFKDQKMTAIVTSEGARQTISTEVPKGGFLASFLAYLMLQSQSKGKQGIQTGVKYGYQAIAEEDATVYTGEAYVAGEEVVSGLNSFRVLNTFKGSQFVSLVTSRGEILATNAPVQKISTELMASAVEATKGFSLNSNSLKILFGNIPEGKVNALSRRGTPTQAKSNSEHEQKTKDVPEEAGSPGRASHSKQNKLNSQTPSAPDVSPKKEGVAGGQGITIKGSADEDAKEPIESMAPLKTPTPPAAKPKESKEKR